MDKNKTIVFTIITPIFNRSDCIARCIESVVNQRYDNYEMIIVNDGSTDNTLEIIETYRETNEKIKVVDYGSNKGVNFARNRGIEEAKGDFIVFLDSDDKLTENALNNIYHSIIKYPNYSHYLFGVSDRVDDKSLSREPRIYNYSDWLTGKISGDFAHVIKPKYFQDLMFIEEFRIYESLSWLRILRKNKTQIYIPIVVSERERNRNDSVTREAILDNRISMRNNYEYIINLIEMYSEDYIKFNAIDSLNYQIRKGLLLGIALGENKRNAILFKHFEFKKRKLTLLKLVNYNFFSTFVYFLIMIRSKYNQRLNIGK